MTGQEQRVAEHLRAYAGGLPVSQNDINLAQEILHDRLDERSARRTRTRLVAAVAAALIVSVGAAVALRDGTDGSAPQPAGDPSTVNVTAPDGLPPTYGLLTGIWKSGSGLLMRFGADGTFAFDPSWLHDPSGIGTYRIDGSTVELTALDGPYCTVVSTFAWLVGLPEPGRFEAVFSGSPPERPRCSLSGEDIASWTRLSPRSPAGALISADGAEEGDLVLPFGSTIYGIWLQEGTGRLLQFLSDQTYSMDDGGDLVTSPDETGTFVRTGLGGVQLTTGAGSRECAPGDSSTWQDVRSRRNAAKTGMNVGSEESTCVGRVSLEGNWVLVSNPVVA